MSQNHHGLTNVQGVFVCLTVKQYLWVTLSMRTVSDTGFPFAAGKELSTYANGQSEVR